MRCYRSFVGQSVYDLSQLTVTEDNRAVLRAVWRPFDVFDQRMADPNYLAIFPDIASLRSVPFYRYHHPQFKGAPKVGPWGASWCEGI